MEFIRQQQKNPFKKIFFHLDNYGIYSFFLP
jgi:hypothetical protein